MNEVGGKCGKNGKIWQKNKNVKIWRIIKQKERRMAGSKVLGGRMLREKVGSQRLRKKPETEDKERRIAVA